MNKKFPEYKNFDLSLINKEMLKVWERKKTFKTSLDNRKDKPAFVFYEGPPSANGIPGIHHVMARTIKDVFCRFKTMKGFFVDRKAGWDTHGLPVELSVEKRLGITKEDIGKEGKISVEEYNIACRKDVMKYTDQWKDLTHKMGYWIDMTHPYITYDNRYIETLWYLLKELYKKDLLYKGYTIQPYSPAAGTGLSTHELNQPGAYRDVKDTTCVAQFKVIKNQQSEFLFKQDLQEVYFLAWTTTPWTLPSNTALAVGEKIQYSKIRSFNPYTGQELIAIVASDLVSSFFPEANKDLRFEDYKKGDKKIPFEIQETFPGRKLLNIRYDQLLKWVDPGPKAFRVIAGDFVTTEEGTGIVHIAPTFGADDFKAGKENDIPPLLVRTINGLTSPLVDKKGRFIRVIDLDETFVKQKIHLKAYKPFEGRYVKNEYDDSLKNSETVDVDIAVHLKQENKVFRIEKHIHNYPHCWRTDKPILYYPLDSWFIRTTKLKDRMQELNEKIHWKPESTGTGRFGKWLENLMDWNLSRSRFWGTPLPVWVSSDRKELICIGSVEELKKEINKSVAAGVMKENPLINYREGDYSAQNYEQFDLHRPFVDQIVLVSDSGKKLFREPDLIDVWFDSGSMPFAQHHYPFAMKDSEMKKHFPADFIAEGVDQTRGWFFTLHAISVMLFDSISFKNIISNGLVLDKKGNKMSKRLGNAVDPFSTIEKYGSDPLRWYIITNAQPWDNLKFDLSGLDEVKRKFFGTLYNIYSFFALYANVDGFTFREKEVPVAERPEIDRWIISLLHSLIQNVEGFYSDYEPTRAGRAIQHFVIENLSNWYVRLNRKRFWGGEYSKDKIAAYQTLYTCLETTAMLAAPIAPFYMDKIFIDLNDITNRASVESVHLVDFPKSDNRFIDNVLEERMDIAQKISSMVLGLRRKVNLKVRQPLNKMMIPVIEPSLEKNIEAVRDLILSEVNVKQIEYLSDTSEILIKKIKPNFKILGPRFGKNMKAVAAMINAMDKDAINQFETEEQYILTLPDGEVTLSLNDVDVISEDIPGWEVATDGILTVALDILVTDELKAEGIARELINRIQNLRKESGLNVTDKIDIHLEKHPLVEQAVIQFDDFISNQTLAREIIQLPFIEGGWDIELNEEIKLKIAIIKR